MTGTLDFPGVRTSAGPLLVLPIVFVESLDCLTDILADGIVISGRAIASCLGADSWPGFWSADVGGCFL